MIERINEVKRLVESCKLSTKYLNQIEESFMIENEDGNIVGFMAFEKRGSFVYIQSLSVDRHYRGWGLGRKLIEKGFESLEKGETMVALTLVWNNKYYKAWGFSKMDAKTVKSADDVGARDKHKHCTAWGMVKV